MTEMTTRLVRKTMVFDRPFRLAGIEKLFPAGIYDVATEEEQIDGVSFPAFRRLQTYVTRRSTPHKLDSETAIVVDLDELARAHRRG